MTALVTGASRGIGRAIALELARQGYDIAVVYAGNEEAAREVCALVEQIGRKAAAIQCDVASFGACGEAVAQAEEALGAVDVLVNNAGITRDNLCMRMDEAQWDECIDVNLKGAFNMIRHASPRFLKRRAGRIINITSVAGLMGNAGQVNYAAAKAGLVGLTKSVAREFGARGITCNAVAPGFVETDMTQSLPQAARDAFLGGIPLKRFGTGEDIAGIVAFLASDAAAYITGAVIPVDGGLSM